MEKLFGRLGNQRNMRRRDFIGHSLALGRGCHPRTGFVVDGRGGRNESGLAEPLYLRGARSRRDPRLVPRGVRNADRAPGCDGSAPVVWRRRRRHSDDRPPGACRREGSANRTLRVRRGQLGSGCDRGGVEATWPAASGGHRSRFLVQRSGGKRDWCLRQRPCNAPPPRAPPNPTCGRRSARTTSS